MAYNNTDTIRTTTNAIPVTDQTEKIPGAWQAVPADPTNTTHFRVNQIFSYPDGTFKRWNGTALVTHTFGSTVAAASSGAWIDVVAAAGLADGSDIAPTLRTYATQAATEGKGLLITRPMTWGSTVVLPANVPIRGEGPRGYARMTVTISDGSPALDGALADYHWVKGLWFVGAAVDQNAIGIRMGQFVDLWEAGTAVKANEVRQAGVSVYRYSGPVDVNGIGDSGTAAPVHTTGTVGVWTYVNQTGTWLAASNVGRSIIQDVFLQDLAVGCEFQGWSNKYRFKAFRCGLAFRATAFNDSELNFKLESCTQPFIMHTATSVVFDDCSVQNGTGTHPMTLAGRMDGITAIGGKLYLEASGNLPTPQSVPFVSVGRRTLCGGFDLSGSLVGLNHPLQYFDFDELTNGSGTWYMSSTSGIRSAVPFTTTQRTGDVSRITVIARNGANDDISFVNPAKMVARNLAPAPNCDALTGWDQVTDTNVTTTLDPTGGEDGNSCHVITAVNGAGICQREYRITDPVMLAQLAGTTTTFRVRCQPLNGAVGAKTSQFNVFMSYIAPSVAGGVQQNKGPSAGNMVAGQWNDWIMPVLLPVDVTRVSIFVQVHLSGTASSADQGKVMRFDICPGGNLGGLIEEGAVMDINPFVRVQNGQTTWYLDTLNTAATNQTTFKAGDKLVYRTPQASGVLSRTCITAGTAATAVFKADPIPGVLETYLDTQPTRHTRRTFGAGVTTTDATATALSSTQPLVLAANVGYGFEARLTGVNTSTKQVSFFILSGSLFWDGTNGRIEAGGAAPTALAASNSAAFLVAANGAGITADQLLTLSSAGIGCTATGLVGSTLKWTLSVDLWGGI